MIPVPAPMRSASARSNMTPRIHNLSQRSELTRALRNFFYDNSFIEVNTPVMIPAPAPEENIESITAERGFLRTSPELAMKVLLADGVERMFQLGAAFRCNEHGRKHREEFTILEYYAKEWNYMQLAAFTAEMIADAFKKVKNSTVISYQGKTVDLSNVEYITVEEAYRKYADVDCFSLDPQTFDEYMVLKVEPKLGDGKITILKDYPIEYAALSRRSATDNRTAERWEIYICGIELGNAFGELTDPAEQKARFAAANKIRHSNNMRAYPEPDEFYAALERGIPESSGCAIGVDRLAMLLCDTCDIADVL